MTVRQAVRRSLRLLTHRDRRLLAVSVGIQMATAFLDLVGVVLLGLVGALAVTTVQSQPPPAPVVTLAGWVGLSDASPQALVIILAAAAAVVLLTKSVVSAFLTRRVFVFLANRQALVTARLTRELLSRPLTFLQRRSSQETAFALMQGAGSATIGVLGQSVVILTELAVLVVLAAGLFLIDPLLTLGAVAFFVVIALILQRLMGNWASRIGNTAARADIASLNAVQEAVAAYREVTVANRRSLYVDRIQDLRWQAARVAADGTLINMIPKYVFEAGLVIGGFALAGVLFVTQSAVEAAGTLALFLAAGSRVMPSILRLQAAALTIRGASGGAASTYALADELSNPITDTGQGLDFGEFRSSIGSGHPGFLGSIELNDVSVTYPGSWRPALSHVTLSVRPGGSVALVGRSGAGKSTLADIILGVLEPDVGTALIDGFHPAAAIERWPGGIAYVPQEVLLSNDTIRANVALGLPSKAIDDDAAWDALTRAHLADYLVDQRLDLDSHIGEDGFKLSGGQRQRLGLARALYTRPRLLVLDEATSALDAETEASITQTITELGGSVTLVIIAHRLSTVRHVDTMVYLEEGRALGIGRFDDIRHKVPALERQAGLLGL